MLAVGDGAILYRDQLESPGRWSSSPHRCVHPEAAAFVELAVPRFLREEHDRLHDVVPMYLRRSDAEIAGSARARPRREVTRMRRRHLRGVMAIERQVYARPWSANLFAAEIADPRNRCYLVARTHKEVVGYGGLIATGTRRTSRTWRSTRCTRATGSRRGSSPR